MTAPDQSPPKHPEKAQVGERVGKIFSPLKCKNRPNPFRDPGGYWVAASAAPPIVTGLFGQGGRGLASRASPFVAWYCSRTQRCNALRRAATAW